LVFEGPKVVEKSIERHPTMGSSSKRMSSNQGRAGEDHSALGLSRSALEGTCGAIEGISGGLGQLVEGLGLSEEAGCTSYVKETEDAMAMMGKKVSMSSDGLVPEGMRGVSRGIVGGLNLSVEINTTSPNGLGRIAVVEPDPSSEPKILQIYQSKDIKPKMKRVTSSGKGSS
jgi:hypothetical protein